MRLRFLLEQTSVGSFSLVRLALDFFDDKYGIKYGSVSNTVTLNLLIQGRLLTAMGEPTSYYRSLPVIDYR